MNLEKLEDKIKKLLQTPESAYALPFAVIVSKEYCSFSEIETPVLPIGKSIITDYDKIHPTPLKEKTKHIIKLFRDEYDTWKENEEEEYFFKEINTIIGELLYKFYKKTLDDDSYPSDEEIMDDSYLDEESIDFELSLVKITGEIDLFFDEMRRDKKPF